MYIALFERLREYYTNGRYDLFKRVVEEIPFKCFRRHILKKFVEYVMENNYCNSVFSCKELYEVIKNNTELDI